MCALALTKIQWDLGTAYDLFVSLRRAPRPDTFGVRASWAAVCTSRLPAEHRKRSTWLSNRSAPLSFSSITLPAPKCRHPSSDTLK